MRILVVDDDGRLCSVSRKSIYPTSSSVSIVQTRHAAGTAEEVVSGWPSVARLLKLIMAHFL